MRNCDQFSYVPTLKEKKLKWKKSWDKLRLRVDFSEKRQKEVPLKASGSRAQRAVGQPPGTEKSVLTHNLEWREPVQMADHADWHSHFVRVTCVLPAHYNLLAGESGKAPPAPAPWNLVAKPRARASFRSTSSANGKVVPRGPTFLLGSQSPTGTWSLWTARC